MNCSASSVTGKSLEECKCGPNASTAASLPEKCRQAISEASSLLFLGFSKLDPLRVGP